MCEGYNMNAVQRKIMMLAQNLKKIEEHYKGLGYK